MSDVIIDHEYTPEIVCPYCGYKYQDSWEEQITGGETMNCNECDNVFKVCRHIEVTYSTFKEEKEESND